MINADEIDNLKRELKTDKVALRQKAFARLSNLLSSNRKVINEIFETNDEPELSYNALYYCAHEGVILQGLKLGDSDINEGDNRIKQYSSALHDLLNASNDSTTPTASVIKNVLLIQSVIDVLKHETLTRHFGNTYLLLLNTLLNASSNLTLVQTNDWKTLLKLLFKLLKKDNTKFRFQFIVECAQKVVVAGCDNSFLAFEMMNMKILDQLKILFESRTSINGDKEKQELLILTYLCCESIAVDYRYEVARFLEEIKDFIFRAFKGGLHDKYRPSLFKLMDLALVTHIPVLSNDHNKIEYISDKRKWYGSMKVYEEMLLDELKLVKTVYRDKSPPKVNGIVTQFAARFCYYAYWNDDIWQEQTEDSDESEQNIKRFKYSNKLQTIIERIKPSQENPSNFNWKWLIVLCELIYNFPDALQNDDILSIVSLLAQCQPVIEFKEQIYAFSKCCSVLLRKDEEFKKSANPIVYNHCQKLWTKIADEAARCCSNSNKNLIESHKILQLLIYHRKYASDAFIEDVVKIYVSNSIVKCDTTLTTLIVLLKRFNLDSLANGKELTKQILGFAFEKITLAVLKKVIAGNEKPSYQILSHLAILCCLLKTDVVNYHKNIEMNESEFYNKIIDLEEQKKYKEHIDSIIHLMRLKSRDKLIIEDDEFLKIPEKQLLEKDLEVPDELKCMIDEEIFQSLLKHTEMGDKIITEQSTIKETKDYLKDLMANNELMMNLLSELLKLEATNKRRMDNLFITKRIVLNVQEIERMFTLILDKNHEFDITDTNQLVTLINVMLSNHYHAAVGKLVRSFNLKNCLKWLYLQVDRDFLMEDEYTNLKLSYNAFLTSKLELKVRYFMVTALCEYFNHDGMNTAIVVEWIDKIQFSMDSIVDIHTIFKVIEIFGRQSNVPELAANWIWGAGIAFICKFHKDSIYVMDRLIEQFPNLKTFTEPHESLTKNYNTVYFSFSKLCTPDSNSKKYFGPKTAANYLYNFRHYHHVYFTQIYDQDQVKCMYENIYKEFLQSKSFEVKMAAINCLSTVLHSECEQENSIEEQKIINACRKNLYKDFFYSFQYTLKETYDAYNDEDVNNLSVYIQLFSSLFCANFNYRRNNLFEIAKIFLTLKLPDKDGVVIFQKIQNRLNCYSPKSIVNSSAVVDLISKWIDLSMEMSKFPWYLVGSESYQDFINDHYNLILLAALQTKIDVVDDYLESIELPLNQAALPIMGLCLAYLIPSKANCAIKYENKVKEMSAKLTTSFSEKEQHDLLKRNIPEILIKILENVVDNQKFLEMCGFQFDFLATTSESIKFIDLEKSMNYIKELLKGSSGKCLMTHLCRSRLDVVEQIFMLQKKKIQGTELKEQKIISLLHYIMLVQETFEYMNDKNVLANKDMKPYLSREIANYFCYLIVTKDSGEKIRIIAADSLLVYLKNILPACCQQFKSQLQKIIPKLISICKKSNIKNESQNLREKCFKIMNFLVLNQSLFKEEIAKLDRFPSSADFDELRHKQLSMKYHDGEFSLIEEIEHFLENDDRRIEGLTALQEHLSAKKSELSYLFDELKKMSSDKFNSILHRLIRSLIKYIRANDEERAIESIKCLGEIGCHNISTIVFNVEDQQNDTTYLSFRNIVQCQRFICSKILEKLESLLLHHNVKIFQVASEACYYLLASASSINFIPSPIFYPFTTDDRSNENLFYLEPKIDKPLGLLDFMAENNFIEYPHFVKNLCLKMTEYAGDKMLILLIQNQLEFAEMLFPLIFHLLLLYNNEVVNNEITKTIVYYFEQCFEKLNYSERTNEGSIFINKKIIRQMLKLVETIRSYCQDNPKSKIAAVQEFNYLHIAKAAKHCEASFTAIQYCEMWTRKQLELKKIDFVTSLKDKNLQDVMYRSYSDIGIKEASEVFLDSNTNRSEYLLNHESYVQFLLEVPKDASCNDYLVSLSKVGLEQIAHGFNKNFNHSKKLHQYDCLWKLSQWDIIVETDSEIKDDKGLVDYQQEFEKYHYLSLKYSSNADEVGVRIALQKSRKMIMEQITHQILECSNSLYKFLEMSHRLAQIEDFSEVLFKRTTNTHELLLKKWGIHDELPFDYEHSKPIFVQRNSIFSTASIKAGKRTWIPDAIQSNTLFTIKQAVLAEKRNDAISMISQLRDAVLSVPKKMEVLIEEAKLHIDTNVELAKNSLSQIMSNNQIKDSDLIIQSTAHRLYGEIMANSFAEPLSDICAKYFDKSIKYLENYAMFHQKEYLLPKLDDDKEMSQFSQSLQNEDFDSIVDVKIRQASCIYETIAKYNDREYEFKSSYISSPDFIQKKNTYLKNSERLQMMIDSIRNADADVKKSYVILQKSTALDKTELDNAEFEKKAAAKNAIYFYVRSTIYSPDDNILNIFRIVALMLAHFKISFVQDFLEGNLLKIPSYKFIIALPQIVVRLNEVEDDPLNCLLKKLLKQCALDHPHHTLPLILALVNSYADSYDDNSSQEPRVTGAKDLWNSLKQHKKLKPIISQMEQMASGLIHLANLPLKAPVIPSDHKVLKLNKLNHVQCPTIEIPLVRNGDYKKCLISIEKWDHNVKNVGGINAPKRIEVLCSDGIKRPQLLKGRDDMRQDAIMQQIFGVVNELLLLDNKMQKIHARIRTYKVVPFSRRSGILGWCENTIPIGNYLVGERGPDGKIITKGAHEIYRPNDWTPTECLKKVIEISTIQNNDAKTEKFLQICEKIKPVFHNFFYEKFRNPGEHFERRFAYTVSVAVSSMIGYILGIGDRHVQNILIDLKTAELIHIDFGVAFEQGKILPHPELIPFRLTRDIIAPFGVSGVDGIFRKTCERTLEILRQNEKALSTILEVLLYDPMYMWSIGVEQARRSQLECDEVDSIVAEEKIEHDLMASRALNSVKSKLKGMSENSSVRYPSVSGQVQYLIQAAINPAFLSRLFRGWQAYI